MDGQEGTGAEQLHTSLTLDMDGPLLSFDKFRKAQDELASLLREVENNLPQERSSSVNWVISSIRAGSVHLTIEGIASEDIPVSQISDVVTNVESGIAILEERPERPPFFSDKALESAKALAGLIGQDIVTIQLRINSQKVTLTQHLIANVDELIGGKYKSFGSVEGILKAIDLSNKKPVFRIYDLLTNKSVKCFFPPKFLQTAKDALGRRVSVYGLILSREDGVRVSVEVEDIEIFPNKEQLPTIEEMIGILGGKD